MTQANQLPEIVEEMLLDAGQRQNSELRAALLALGSLASLPAPAPSGELAVLLAESEDESAGGPGGRSGISDSGPGDDLAERRRIRAHRPTVVGLALIAGMGLGVGGVAASTPVPGHSGSPSIQHLLEGWAPAWSLLVPNALESGLRDALDGHDAEAAVQDVLPPGVSEENVTGGGSAVTAPAAEDHSATPRVPEVPVPNTPGQVTQGNAEAQRGGGEGLATDAGKSDAGAAGRESQGAGGLPEQAVGHGAGAQRESKHVAGAVPGARADTVPGAIRQGANAAGAPVKALPGTKWLQKFTR
ncbi:hypothetical protein [Arthrobacter sp. ZGTC412]|uniref:hypothetical protein n=1 Tax=Arthrobacter sp. ZGTC412 TaxID=2058900 RepID=UPI000CE2C89F|nr:hypothetical protein [Arthrobacter sp. ZGTC412]